MTPSNQSPGLRGELLSTIFTGCRLQGLVLGNSRFRARKELISYMHAMNIPAALDRIPPIHYSCAESQCSYFDVGCHKCISRFSLRSEPTPTRSATVSPDLETSHVCIASRTHPLLRSYVHPGVNLLVHGPPKLKEDVFCSRFVCSLKSNPFRNPLPFCAPYITVTHR